MKQADFDTKRVSVEKAHELINGPTRIITIDVRTPAEFEARHIPGSHNIPLDQLPTYLNEIAQLVKDAPVLLICQSGTRARKAADLLRGAAIPSVALLDGGMAAWETAGKASQQGIQKWSLERQVRGVAGTLVLVGALGGIFLWQPLTWISALIGAGLAYSAASNTCGMAMVLSKLPYNQGATCDVRETLNAIASNTR